METLYFGNFTLTDLDKRFGLEQVRSLASLTSWLVDKTELTDLDTTILEKYQEMLFLNVNGWNEQELSLHFIGPVFTLAEISSHQYNLFANRQIGAQIGEYYLTGKPDGMIASGYREPEIPYFAFNEYKKEKDPDGDPAAQALAAMLVGHQMNSDIRPLYGCYVIGQNWYFLALENNRYAISPAYSALTDDLLFIFQRLKLLKAIVEQYVLQLPGTFAQTPTVA